MSIVDEEKVIYLALLKPPILTIIIGAKCYDGIVMIADRKITDMTGNTLRYKNKIFADMEHILIGYGGGAGTFDIFRKYIVGDITLLRHDKNAYTFDNFIPKAKESVRRFNNVVKHPNFEIIVGKHRGNQSELYHIKQNGEAIPTDYITIGSGKATADMFLENKNNYTDMRTFSKSACLAITYMNRYIPDDRVGFELNGFPTIKYLDYDKYMDEEVSKQEIEEFRIFIDKKLNEHDNNLKNLINSL